MDYFAGLDISMDETHVCVVDREGVVVHQTKTASTAAAIAVELAKAPSCRRIVFETGRMAPILFHGLSELGLPGLASRAAGLPGAQVARHPQDRSQRRARSGDIGPHRLLQARACKVAISSRSPFADQRAQEAGRAEGDLGNQIRGLAVVFGIRLPRALPPPPSTRLSRQARGSLAFLPLCGV